MKTDFKPQYTGTSVVAQELRNLADRVEQANDAAMSTRFHRDAVEGEPSDNWKTYTPSPDTFIDLRIKCTQGR